MKKAILISLSGIAPLCAAMAQDCKGVKTEVDKFTKKEVKTGSVHFGKIKVLSFKGSTKWLMTAAQENGRTTITASIAALGEFNQSLDESTEFYFLLDNNEVVTLRNAVVAKPVTQAIASGGALTVFTTYLLTLEPTMEELKKLAGSNVTDVKVAIPGQEIQPPEVGGKDAKTFRSIIECLIRTAQ